MRSADNLETMGRGGDKELAGTPFFVWKIYQRRAESLAKELGLDVYYIHYPWEERSKFAKAISYVFKLAKTFGLLVRLRPRYVFVQLPPTPLLYLVGGYRLVTGARFVADCHNAMINGGWEKWPLATACLRRASAVLVHNSDMIADAKKIDVSTEVLRDPLPRIELKEDTAILQKYDLVDHGYIILAWNFAFDEPIREFFAAARSLPHVRFVMTWFKERLPQELRDDIPANVLFTGFLEESSFNNLFGRAAAALTLTTREGTQPSSASEAIATGVPLVISELETTRRLYGDVPVYVANEPNSIASGIETVLRDREQYRKRIDDFREKFRDSLLDELVKLRSKLVS